MNAFCANSEPNRSAAPRHLHHPRSTSCPNRLWAPLNRNPNHNLAPPRPNLCPLVSIRGSLSLSKPLFRTFSRYFFMEGGGRRSSGPAQCRHVAMSPVAPPKTHYRPGKDTQNTKDPLPAASPDTIRISKRHATTQKDTLFGQKTRYFFYSEGRGD